MTINDNDEFGGYDQDDDEYEIGMGWQLDLLFWFVLGTFVIGLITEGKWIASIL